MMFTYREITALFQGLVAFFVMVGVVIGLSIAGSGALLWWLL